MKNTYGVASWLRAKAGREAKRKLLAGIGTMAAAALVLLLTFWLIDGVVWLVMFWNLAPTQDTRLFISGIALVLIVMANAKADSRELESVSFTTGTMNRQAVNVYVPRVGIGSNINPLAPDSAHSFVKIFASMLLTGPRLLSASFQFFAAARRLSMLDVDGCAAVLALLLEQDGRTPFADIATAIPPGGDLEDILRQLRDIDGVLFLSTEPAGLALMTDLRAELPRLPRK